MRDADLPGLVPALESAFRASRPRVVEAFRAAPEAARFKPDGSAVTDLDLRLEETLARVLLDVDPSFGLVSEEGGALRPGRPAWHLDPVDGTSNFARRIPVFASQVVLVDGSEPLFAAVYEPLRDDFSWAARGAGAWREGRRVAVSTVALSRAIVMVDLAESGMFVDDPTLLARLRAAVYRIRALGTIGLHLRDVASGAADGYAGGRATPSPVHDVAPGVLLVREAGGRATDASGGDPIGVRRTLVAGPERVHAALLDLLRGTPSAPARGKRASGKGPA